MRRAPPKTAEKQGDRLFGARRIFAEDRVSTMSQVSVQSDRPDSPPTPTLADRIIELEVQMHNRPALTSRFHEVGERQSVHLSKGTF